MSLRSWQAVNQCTTVKTDTQRFFFSFSFFPFQTAQPLSSPTAKALWGAVWISLKSQVLPLSTLLNMVIKSQVQNHGKLTHCTPLKASFSCFLALRSILVPKLLQNSLSSVQMRTIVQCPPTSIQPKTQSLPHNTASSNLLCQPLKSMFQSQTVIRKTKMFCYLPLLSWPLDPKTR